jgi:hypothetical protein
MFSWEGPRFFLIGRTASHVESARRFASNLRILVSIRDKNIGGLDTVIVAVVGGTIAWPETTDLPFFYGQASS